MAATWRSEVLYYLYIISFTPLYTSSTPLLHLYTSFTPPLHLYTSFTPHLHLLYTCTPPLHLYTFTPPLHLLYTSFTPPLHLLYTSSTPPLHLLYTLFTQYTDYSQRFWQFSSSNRGPPHKVSECDIPLSHTHCLIPIVSYLLILTILCYPHAPALPTPS